MQLDQTLTEAMFALRLPHAVPMQQMVPGGPLELGPGIPQVELPTVKKKKGKVAQVSCHVYLLIKCGGQASA